LNVLFATVEMSPLAKVGGLGDVAGSLPRALRARGDDVRVAMPMHGAIERTALHPRHLLHSVKVAWPDGDERVDVWQADVRGVPVYLLENERFFGRAKVYGFEDDNERFLFFCDALLACAPHLGFRPDVIHAQDWHAALLLTRLAGDERHPWAAAGRVYTIHNLALQGSFPPAFAHHHQIAAPLLVPPEGVEHEVGFSAMAQGIMHADRVNTVSDTYAKEILTPEYGAGLDGLLRARQDVVSGIVNGIDYEEFNPATDAAITQHFTVETADKRIENKRALQAEAGLPVSDGSLMFGAVTRLFAQKGMDLVAAAFDALLASRDMQLAILGTGDEDVQVMLQRLMDKYPRKVKIWFDFNLALGQRIYAGCDVFLMPSRYEPCGLGQLISLRYGAVPLVRRTGGLSDTVQDADLPLRSGTGFVFDAASAHELEHAAERALAAFEDQAGWRALRERGMRQDWSWGRAAGKYADLYRLAVEDRARAREGASA
jgi:starch synthase